MPKRYRLIHFAGALLVTLLLIGSTVALLHLVERAPTRHSIIPLSLFRRQSSEQQGALRVMPLGDSITAGVGTIDHGGYREPLWEKIKAAGWDINFVGSQQGGPAFMTQRANEGHPGWRVDQISGRIVGWLEATQPQVILLHIGTNDIIQGYSPAVIATRLAYLLDQITTTLPGALVVVAQIIPLGDSLLNARVVAYNHMIPPLVHNLVEQGDHVSYVDMYHIIPASTLIDHIHPNMNGYARIASVWFQVLSSIMAQKN